MKVSRQGYDVKSCADNELLFSSSFKMPVVVHSGTWSGVGSQQDIYTHNLGFYPVVLAYFNTHGSGIISISEKDFRITKTKIYDSANDNYSCSYFITNLDLDVDYVAPIINSSTTTQGSYNSDWGFKVSKDGINVKTATLQDLVSFSGASSGGYPVRHQIIHKIAGYANQTTNTTITIAHGLSYKPMFYLYRQGDTGVNKYYYPYIYDSGQNNAKLMSWADNTNINIFQDYGGNESWRIVIFKDPLL